MILRKRIQDLSRGKFIFEEPDVEFLVDSLEVTAYPNERIEGSVKMVCKNGMIQKGIVYTTNNRMECKVLQFENNVVEIPYEFHSEGLEEGDVLRGRFIFICNKGEYNLPFVVEIKKYYAQTSRGQIQSLGQFLALARTNIQEAYQLFCQPYFVNIMDDRDVYARMLYECLGGTYSTPIQLEEYLISLGLKEPVHYSLNNGQVIFNDLEDNQVEKVTIKKDGWGYNHLRIETDADFLIPLRSEVTTEDFIGQELELEFLIDVHQIGKGVHHGQLLIDTGKDVVSYEIIVHQDTAGSVLRKEEQEYHRCFMELAQKYVLYRVGDLSVGLWAEQSMELVDKLMKHGKYQNYLTLYQAQILYFSGRKQEASWILDAYKKEKTSKDTPEYGYYLYLTTLINREHSYVLKMAEKIDQLYQKYPASQLLFWIRLFVKEDYARYKGRRLQVILDRIQKGCSSPFLYAEGYHLIKEEPFLLHDLSKPVYQLLHWVANKGLLTRDLVQRIVELTQGLRLYSKTLHVILQKGYSFWPNRDVIQAICQNLLRGQCYGAQYYEWYQAGVMEDLPITNLYEAYLMSITDWSQITYPKVIQYYIKFKTRLPVKQRAALYAGMVQNKAQERLIYANSQIDIERFLLSQLSEGRIDENLSVLYEDYLDNHFLNHELAVQMSKVLFMRKVICSRQDIVRLHIFQSGIRQVMQIPVNRQVAMFPILSDVFLIGMEDKRGQIHVNRDTSELIHFMNVQHSMADFIKAANEQEEYWTSYFLNKKTTDKLEDFEVPPLHQFLDSTFISELRKKPFRIALLIYYKESGLTQQLDQQLNEFSVKDETLLNQQFVIETMIERKLFDRALEELRFSNFEAMKVEYLTILISNQILMQDYCVNDFLLLLSFYLFEQKSTDPVILKYLVLYYYGTLRQMEDLWVATNGMDFSTFDLKERILVQMLYTENYLQHSDEIFQQYMDENGKILIRDAYLSYYSYAYIMKNIPLNHFLHVRLEILFEQKEELHEMELLALLKGYSQRSTLNEKQLDHACYLYQLFARKKFKLQFFLDLPEQITQAYPLNECRIIEHHCKPHTHVMISYRLQNQNVHQEEMNQVYPGYYQKEFSLFFGEILEYSIHEMQEDKDLFVRSGTVENCEFTGTKEQCFYDCVNEILYQNTIGEPALAAAKLQMLKQKRLWIKENFGLLEL